VISFKGEEKMKFIPADFNLLDKVSIEDSLVGKDGDGITAPMARYCFQGKGTIHFVLVCIPESDSKIKIKQKDTPDGTALKIKTDKKESVILMRNSESEEISAFGYHTSQIFDVIKISGT